MDLLSLETLQLLLIRVRDPELSAEAHEAAADRIRERFPVEAHAAAYARIACHAAITDDVTSFVLRILYVLGRKRPDANEPKEAFRTMMGQSRRPLELRTQAFLHLLLTDIDLAERAAGAVMPEMLPLVAAERRYPTIRRAEDPVGAAYEEATLKLLFH